MLKAILWVDDDPATNDAYRDELGDFGFNVMVARNPDDMWRLLGNENIKVSGIIMDVLMPLGTMVDPDRANGGLKTGLVLIEQILLVESLRNIPMIIFTIRSSHDVDEFGDKHGIGVYRKQDTTPEELGQIMSHLLCGAR